MADRRLFLAGLAVGAIGGFLTRRLLTGPCRMPHLDVSQPALAEANALAAAKLVIA